MNRKPVFGVVARAAFRRILKKFFWILELSTEALGLCFQRQIMKDSRGFHTLRPLCSVLMEARWTGKPVDSACSRSNALKSYPGFNRN
jgi:hypothetical protein